MFWLALQAVVVCQSALLLSEVVKERKKQIERKREKERMENSDAELQRYIREFEEFQRMEREKERFAYEEKRRIAEELKIKFVELLCFDEIVK